MERRGPSYTIVWNVNWYSHYGEQYGASLKKTKKRTIMWSSNPTPGHASVEKHDLRGFMHLSVHCSTVYNSQNIEAILISTDREMETKSVVHIYNEILLSH